MANPPTAAKSWNASGCHPAKTQAITRTTSWGKKCTADTQTDATGNSSRGR